MNPKGVTLWTTEPASPSGRALSKEARCIWARHGVWGYDADTKRPIVLKEGYFTKDAQGRGVNFYTDFYWPFVKRWEDVVKQRSGGKAMLHVEGVPNEVSFEGPDRAPNSLPSRLKSSRPAVLPRLARRRPAAGKARVFATLVRPERPVQQELRIHDRQRPGSLESKSSSLASGHYSD